MQGKSKKDIMVTLAVMLVIIFIITGSVVANNQEADTESEVAASSSETEDAPVASETPAPTTATTPVVTPAPAPTNTSGFKDGSYKATGQYSTPEDTESLTLNITIKDGVITGTSATASAISHESKEYSAKFIQNYKSQVVGKSIASIKLSRVSGSSLTSQGFNSAIEKIKAQAQV